MDLKEKVERWKATAEIFLKNNTPVFIEDINNNFYFGDIILVGESIISIKCFSPKDRAGQKFNLYWTLITKFEEYRR